MQTPASSYVDALEAERAKMMMFKSELPLSIQLVSHAIDSCKGRLILAYGDDVDQQITHACDSLSEETTGDDFDVDVARPVLEFIPIKKKSSDGSSSSESGAIDHKGDGNALGKKSDWLSSAQLWNESPDLPTNSEDLAIIPDELENLDDKCKLLSDKKLEENSPTYKQTESSSAESQKSGGCKKENKEGSSNRKQRRCWSQDLHRRFLNSLKQLGGAHVATPKQIRELMKVDGLTNDEVKSHLQKYRMHTRRPAPPSSQRNVQAPPQFVVVGSIWATSSDYNAMTPTAPNNRERNGALGTSRTRVYTPMAAPSLAQPHSLQERRPFDQKSQFMSKDNEGHGDAFSRCISTSMSSSTRTTSSQVY